MPPALFPHLFQPLRIRGAVLKNRIMSTGHDTCLPRDGRVNDAYVAYQEARAAGGAGLIVTQVAGVHETARYTSHLLMADTDACIPGYRRLAEACHRHGAVVVSQLFHPGREIIESPSGMLPVAWSASATPTERFRVMPRPMSREMIAEIVQGYAGAARRMREAGMDGVEFVGSHGYLPAQFLDPRVNRRTDGYGGSPENRLRFLREALAAMRAATDEDFVIGMRLSASDRDENGLTHAETLQAAQGLEGLIDYLSVTVGTSASLAGAVHITAPMAYPAAYAAPEARPYKQALSVPVFAVGRINQPQEAEAVIARGEADVCGMTRALICDPLMPAKTQAGRLDDIRACIGCNQACIHHFHKGLPVSCIQFPESGRELAFGRHPPAPAPRRVMVVGGGPAGLKAAAVAAARGHKVTLFEAGPQLGGQILLAQRLPGRAEFGGLATNLSREAELAGVTFRRGTRVDAALIRDLAPDAVILATGARPHVPQLEGEGAMQVLTAWQLLEGEARAGGRVVVFDWRADWIGPGLALMLARAGSRVDLAVAGVHMGENVPLYVRDGMAGDLHRQGIPVTPYARLFGTDGDTVFLQHIMSGQPILFEGVDTLVLSAGHLPVEDLAPGIRALGIECHAIGDCLAPRTAEEAVHDGMIAGRSV